jgi:hypothetical protein
MEVVKQVDDDVYRFDDDINTVGIGLIVRSLRRRYPYIIGYRVVKIDTVIFIDLEVDGKVLGKGSPYIKDFYSPDVFFEGISAEDVDTIREMVINLYKELPEEFVDFYSVTYGWSDKEYVSRRGLQVGGFYMK